MTDMTTPFDVAPLAILPGLMCDDTLFRAQLAAFPDALVIDDFYGEEDRLEGMAAHALARLPERVSLLGHSMGGRIALEVCRMAPERVARLALFDTGVHAARPGEAAGRYGLRDLGRAEGMAALVNAWLPPMLSPAAREDAGLVETLTAMCLRAGLACFEAQTEALLNRRAAEEVLAALACPVLVATGELDAWSPPEQHRMMAEKVAGARLDVFAGAGHMVPVEAPGAVNVAIAGWLKR